MNKFASGIKERVLIDKEIEMKVIIYVLVLLDRLLPLVANNLINLSYS
jgi:hypothetical protein